ncbi:MULTISPECIES: DUF4190 domain-containing protein [unclassified Nocardioides]|uniref:DUF4190 domain-containing protein n=1 Tax=unclassified Nocardioides TaxID=2615069 RepID=UPI000700663F|nr:MULTISPECIES: DUF4190 domain-containing protein [unclassified Nocardioides]KRA29700.1 hypothetical protein ASD81_22395 [Nocardioides sp. Root614]KRA88124.1 hypothetical protein ASD84_19220 [Nocardioides sp. Root682]
MSNPYGGGFPPYEPPNAGSYTTPGAYGEPYRGSGSTDGVSIAALVCSLTCCAAPVAIGLGIAGIVRTKGDRRTGRWAAITGLVLGSVITLALVAFVAFAAVLGVRTVYVADARVGQCVNFDFFDDLSSGECDEPHEAEVVWVGRFDAALIREYSNNAFDEFCALRDLTPEHAAAAKDEKYALGIFIDTFDDYPEDGDWFLCYIERADGEPLEGRLTEDGGAASADPDDSVDESIEVDDLVIGDCFNDPVLRGLETDEQGDALGQLHRLPCNGPHDFEVYGELDLKGDKFPGDDAILRLTDRCLPLFRKYVGRAYGKSSYESYSYYPSKDSWEMGDRAVVCVLADPGVKERTRSAKNTKI